MTGELINMDGLGTALIYIADKLGLTVAQMYEIYVKAQATMAFIQIAMICICVAVGIITMIIVYYIFTHVPSEKSAPKTASDDNKKPEFEEEMEAVGVAIFIGIIAMLIAVVICTALYTPLIAYFCPEYTALKSLMVDIGNMATILR